jgi:hypothetical protein
MARKHLYETIRQQPGITVNEIDILSSPRATWKAGIRMIPAIQIEGEVLSSLYLNRKAITRFVSERLQQLKAQQPSDRKSSL